MNHFAVLLFSLVFTANFATGQNLRQLTAMGDEMLSSGNIYGAVYYYGEAVKRDSSKLQNVYKYAEALRLYNSYALAAHYFNFVYKTDRGKDFPEAQFWLASMQKSLGDLRNAKRNFRGSLRKFRRDKKSYFFKKATKELESAAFAEVRMRHDSAGVIIENVKELNATQSEFGISTLGDSLILFSSLRQKGVQSTITEGDSVPFIRLFVARKDSSDKSWGEPEPLIFPKLSMNGHLANPSLNHRGNKLYFSFCPSLCKIYVARKEGGSWLDPEPLPSPVNLGGFNNTQPNISKLKDGREVLFFTSNRGGVDRNLDIYYAFLDSTGIPGMVYQAGDSINSPDDEISPFYDAVNEKLYFSSTWHNGFGGFDIFMSRGLPGQLASPYNLGIPLNTGANDFYFTPVEKGNTGYLASNRSGSMVVTGETCCNDIYRFETPEDTVLPPPTVTSTMDELKKYIPLTLYFHNDEPNPRSTDTLTSKTYTQTLREYVPLKESFIKEYSKGLEGPEAEDAALQMESFFEDVVIAGGDELNRFKKLLLEALDNGFEINLTIKGYASTLAESDYNINLTRRRISSLKNDLAQYQGGAFLPYIEDTARNGAFLQFTEIPFGEFRAAEDVSDNLNDLQNSVYGIKASRERKIEILAVSVTDTVPDELPGDGLTLIATEQTIDFGRIAYGESIEHHFVLQNVGRTPIRFQRAIESCGCTVAELSKEAIAPGDSTEVKVVFDSTGKFGRVVNTITVVTDGEPRELILTLTGEVYRD